MQKTEQYLQQSFLEECFEGTTPDAPLTKRKRSSRKEAAPREQSAPQMRKAEKLLGRICLRIGMPMHMRGYSMLSSGVLMAMAEPELVHRLTNGLYVRLAAQFGCSVSCIERDIRNVIAVTWERGSPEEAARLIGASLRPEFGRPTNGELISMLVERLRIESDLL